MSPQGTLAHSEVRAIWREDGVSCARVCVSWGGSVCWLLIKIAGSSWVGGGCIGGRRSASCMLSGMGGGC